MLATLFALAIASQAEPTPDGEGLDPTKPEVIAFGETVAAMQARLADHCGTISLRSFDPPRIPAATKSHSQIDCHGFDFLGAPRLAEFVFVDDSLALVWILVDREEKDAIVAAMRRAYEAEGLEAGVMLAFREQRTAWRDEPAELLFYSEALAPSVEARIASQ